MNRKTLLTAALFLVLSSLLAQSPEKISYQAIIRDAEGGLVKEQSVGVQISILQNTIDGSAVYIETQTPIANSNGLISIEIGGSNATVLMGNFSTIDWADGTYFIKTEVDPTGGVDYTISGTSQLLSVPYALHSKTAERITGDISYTETDPIFASSLASSISSTDTSNWNNKLNTESDPFFIGSIASGISEADTANWNSKLDTYSENDPIFSASPAASVTSDAINSWNNKLDNEVDGSVTNEIQTMTVSKTGDTLSLSDSNWIIIPGISYANHPPKPKPVIMNIVLSTEAVSGGTNIILTITVDHPYAESVNWANISFNGPSGNIYSEGSSASFAQTDPGIWEYTKTDFVANTAPSGDYFYNNIYVKSTVSNVDSDIWPNELKVTITN